MGLNFGISGKFLLRNNIFVQDSRYSAQDIFDATADAFTARQIWNPTNAIGVIATFAVETNGRVITEYASGVAYENRKDLGNIKAGDGPLYRGRGLIQITGRANYRVYGQKLNIPLEHSPELALELDVAANIAAQYWLDRDITRKCAQRKWSAVRRAVNGGLNGFAEFSRAVAKLEAIIVE